MLGVLLPTALCLFLAWFFLVRKPSKGSATAESGKETKSGKNNNKQEAKTTTSASSPQRDSQSDNAKATKGTEKKPKTHADHRFFFKSFKYNDGVVQDLDFSGNAEWMLTASQNRQHLMTYLKTIAFQALRNVCVGFQIRKLDDGLKTETSLKFTTNTIPQSASVSQGGKYVAMLLENKVALFERTASEMRTGPVFVAAQDIALGALIAEEIDTKLTVVVAGGDSHCNFNVYTTKGGLIKTVRGDISDAFDVLFDKKWLRGIYFSKSSNDIRIFRLQLTSKGDFKDFAKEHTLCGHTSGVINASFDGTGTRLFSLSMNKSLKLWDLSPEGFKDIHIKCITTVDLGQLLSQFKSFEIIPGLTKVQWVGTDQGESGKEETHIISIAQGHIVHFLKVSASSSEYIESVEDPNGEDQLNKLCYIFDQRNPSKGVFVTKGQKRVFAWKVRYGS